MPLTRLGAEPQRREVPALKSSLWPSGFGGFLVFVWLVVIHLTVVLGLAMYPVATENSERVEKSRVLGWPAVVSRACSHSCVLSFLFLSADSVAGRFLN